MPRPVNPERHRARRLQIIDAGLTVFAQEGYAGATTAAICKEAGIGSGTFFHYFKTKRSLVLAILEEGAAETREFFAAREGRDDAPAVLSEWVHHCLADLTDPRAPGFIAVVSGLVNDDDIAAALAQQEQLTRSGLTHWLTAAQDNWLVRTDLPPERLARWMMLIVDGFTGQAGASTGFDLDTERPLLFETLSSLVGGELNRGDARHGPAGS